jgi:hypothetical protein
MNDTDWKVQKALHRSAIVLNVCAGDVIHDSAVIDGVASEQRSVVSIEEGDAAGRMAGEMQDVKTPVAKIHHIAFGYESRWNRAWALARVDSEASPGHRIDKNAVGLEARRPQPVQHDLTELSEAEAARSIRLA